MQSDKPVHGEFHKPEKSNTQRNFEKRQRKKARREQFLKAVSELEKDRSLLQQRNDVFREVLVAQSNELLEAQIGERAKTDQIKALQTTSATLGERVQELESVLASETSARQRAERRAAYAEFHCEELHRFRQGARSSSSVRVGEFLKSLRNVSHEVSGQAAVRTPDQV